MEQQALIEAQRQTVEHWLGDCPRAGCQELLSTLPYNLRRVLELRYGLADGHHYSPEETASVLGRSVPWVAELEARAIVLLYETLASADSLRGA